MTIFNWVWKVIRDSISFASLRSVIGPENSRHSKPIRCKTKTNHNLVTRVFPHFKHCYKKGDRWFCLATHKFNQKQVTREARETYSLHQLPIKKKWLEQEADYTQPPVSLKNSSSLDGWLTSFLIDMKMYPPINSWMTLMSALVHANVMVSPSHWTTISLVSQFTFQAFITLYLQVFNASRLVGSIRIILLNAIPRISWKEKKLNQNEL